MAILKPPKFLSRDRFLSFRLYCATWNLKLAGGNCITLPSPKKGRHAMQPPNIQNPAIWSPQTLVNKPRRRFRCKMIELDLPRCQGTKTHQKTMVSDTSGMHPPKMQHDSSNKNSFLFIPKKILDTLNQRVRPTKKQRHIYNLYNIINLI